MWRGGREIAALLRLRLRFPLGLLRFPLGRSSPLRLRFPLWLGFPLWGLSFPLKRSSTLRLGFALRWHSSRGFVSLRRFGSPLGVGSTSATRIGGALFVLPAAALFVGLRLGGLLLLGGALRLFLPRHTRLFVARFPLLRRLLLLLLA